MKKIAVLTLALACLVLTGFLVSPLVAQPRSGSSTQCFVGEGSNAACSGRWIFFAGNTSAIDSGAWVVRIDGQTGTVWYRDGKKLVQLREPE